MTVRILSDDETLCDSGILPETASVYDKAVHALRTVLDPELPLNIYDLGLIYKIDIQNEAKTIHLTMTLTAPNCPVAEELPRQAQQAVQGATGYATTLSLTFDPPWSKETLSLEAQLTLGLL